MLIGHYAAALVAKRHVPEAPLGALFVAAQLLDVLFFLLTLCGVESYRVGEGFGPQNLFLDHHPYSHSLVSALALGFFAFLLGALKSRAFGLAFGMVVLSHWILDFIVHFQDLPLLAGPKVGLGLWEYKHLSSLGEIGLLTGAFFYLFTDQWKGSRQLYLLFVLIFSEVVYTYYLPLPESPWLFAPLAWGVMGAHGYAAQRASLVLSPSGLVEVPLPAR